MPPKLVEAFNVGLKSQGYVLNHALAAAAIFNYLNMSPAGREACFDRYAAYARDKVRGSVRIFTAGCKKGEGVYPLYKIVGGMGGMASSRRGGLETLIE